MSFAFPALLLLAPILAAGGWLSHALGGRPPAVPRRLLRTLLAALGAAAAAGPSVGREAPGAAWVAAVDVSKSMDLPPGEGARIARRLLAPNRLGPRALAGAVAFAATASVEADPSAGAPLPDAFRSAPDEDATDLEAGLAAAAGALGRVLPGSPRAVALVTDGRETRGAWRRTLPILRTVGIRVFPVEPPSPFDVSVESLEGPAAASPGAPVALAARVRLTAPPGAAEGFSAGVLLFREPGPDPVARTGPVPLSPGAPEEVRLEDPSGPAASGGSVRYRAELSPAVAPDHFPENDAAYLRIPVAGGAAVLDASGPDPSPLHAPTGLSIRHLAQPRPADLAGFQAILLDDPDPAAIPAALQRAIAGFVRGGGGLLFLGGPRSGRGEGFRGTPIEEVLPVWLDPDRDRRREVLFVLDASGSMDEEVPGGKKCVLARDALVAVAREWVREGDSAGVLPFRFGPVPDGAGLLERPLRARPRDADPERWLSELRAWLSDERLKPAGQTEFLSLLDGGALGGRFPEGGEALRHVVLVTDGGNTRWPAEGDPARQESELAARGVRLRAALAERRIRLTLILLARGTRDEARLRWMLPDGRPEAEIRILESPERLAKEIGIALRQGATPAVSGTALRVRPAAGDPWARRIEGLPPLAGRLRASARDEGALRAAAPDDGGPVLALRAAAGLGRSAFFAASPRSFARAWAGGEGERLLQDLLAAACPPPPGEWTARAVPDGAAVRIVAERATAPPPGAPVPAVEASLDRPDAAPVPLVLAPETPSRFAARLVDPPAGAVLRIGGERIPLPLPSGAETRRVGPDRAALRAIAAETGGRVLAAGEPLPLLPGEEGGRRPLAPWLALGCALLLLLEAALALRR